MKLYVIFRDGKPLELPVGEIETAAALASVSEELVRHGFCSTNRQHIELLVEVLPGTLDADDDLGLEIREFEI